MACPSCIKRIVAFSVEEVVRRIVQLSSVKLFRKSKSIVPPIASGLRLGVLKTKTDYLNEAINCVVNRFATRIGIMLHINKSISFSFLIVACLFGHITEKNGTLFCTALFFEDSTHLKFGPLFTSQRSKESGASARSRLTTFMVCPSPIEKIVAFSVEVAVHRILKLRSKAVLLIVHFKKKHSFSNVTRP